MSIYCGELVNIFSIPNNNKSVRKQPNNQYAVTESGHINNTELIKFIDDIIAEHAQDQPAAWLSTHQPHTGSMQQT